ncbi:MAG: hypothetical protein IT372_10140 [Polyangiaceae bacterium]|nr:hypothetical protein [Polyangiaceae bacterium]
MIRRWTIAAVLSLTAGALAGGCAAGSVTGGGGPGGAGTGGEAGGTPTGGGGPGGGGAGGEGAGPPVDCVTAEDCESLNGPCAQGTCVNGTCAVEPANQFGSCTDGEFCTENDTCVDGVCVGGTEKFCPSPDSCHVGFCNEGTDACVSVPGNDGAECDDGNSCTTVGVCSNGTCNPGQPVDCSFYDSQCTVGACDPQTGCHAQPSNEGGACNDGLGSPCTTGQCQSGMCVSVPANENGPCDDNLFCTTGEHCVAGQCTGAQPNPCAPPGGCYIASCDEINDQCTAVPGNDGQPCDDFSPCTTGTTCSSGACINGAPANDGAACDDGTACTTGEFCTNGVCGGGAGPQVYFSEDFHDNSKGWTLGPEWQIGSATASVGGVFGADPAADHTSTSDNGVAGVVIGGNASTNLHGYYYIESPPFNTGAAVGPVILGFYRWLNSDYDPYMHNTVEVWNGSSWITLWTSGPPPGIQDSPPTGLGWTFIQHDLTAYKNAGMRIRFGFDITSGGVYTIGSWNIDDILVASAACP